MLELEGHIKVSQETVRSPNLTSLFSVVDLQRIGEDAWKGYDRDKSSRVAWEKRMEVGMALAMQIVEEKSFPWPNAANVAFPLVTIATLQFHSRAYPALLNGGDLVKVKPYGPDPEGKELERSERIATHMSYQLLEEDQAWEEQHDRLLINIPIVGCAFKKTYHKASVGENRSELVLAKDLVMNYFAASVESCRRKTHVFTKHKNDVWEGVKAGYYRDVLEEAWYKQLPTPLEMPKNDGTTPPMPDSATPFTFLEQHCYLDLDGDGYEEPVIVTIEESSKTVIRLVYRFDQMGDVEKIGSDIVRIHGTEYFTKYGFIPAPDGSVYDMGFGVLLGSMNHTVNTLINQLLDSGSMSNLAGGFLGRGAKIRGGKYTFEPWEWKRVDSTGDDLRKNIVPLEVREPSAVLFNLLGLLIQYADRIPGSTEIMVGENVGQNTPAETGRTMVEQGTKVYAAIFKRVWRSMKEEFKKLFVLNTAYMPSNVKFGQGYSVSRQDYLIASNRVCPAADPNVVSDSMRYMQAITIAQRASQVPGYDPRMVEENLLKALKVDGWKAFYPGFDPANMPKDVKLQIAEMNAQVELQKMRQDMQKFVIEMLSEQRVNMAQIIELEAKAKEHESNAASEEGWQRIETIKAMLSMAKQQDEALAKRIELSLKALELKNERDKPDK